MSFNGNSNLCPSCYMMKSQLDNNNNSTTLNVIKEIYYSNFRQLMDIALKNIPLKEKHKYMERVFDDYYQTLSIVPPSYYLDFSEDEATSTSSSIDISGQLPYEINFDGDDDFERVLPKFVTWDLATAGSDLSSSSFKTTDDSDFQYINCHSQTKPTQTLKQPKEKAKKDGLWTKVKKVFTRLIQCFGWKQRKFECQTFENVSDKEVKNDFSEKKNQIQGRETEGESNPLLQTKGIIRYDSEFFSICCFIYR